MQDPMDPEEPTQPNPPELACASNCDCRKPSGHGRLKIAVTGLVLLAAVGILLFKQQRGKGTVACAASPLASLGTLNSLAADKDAVFIVVPAAGAEKVPEEAAAAVNAVRASLEAKGLRLAVFNLAPGSPDYSQVTAQTPAPCVLALTKGRGVGAATAPVTQAKLMQAYVASTQAGGACCPSSGGSSAPCP